MFKRLLRSCFAGEPSSERYAEKMIIGGGSFSTVVVANDTLMGEKVVLKKAKNTEQKREIFEEYTLLRRLDHPNIIKPKDYDSEGLGFVVLPFYMEDVYDRIVKKRPSAAEMKMFVKKITSAMEYLHSQDIVHRDIKPENIFISDDHVALRLG
jgi:serine/threonine protein kinase